MKQTHVDTINTLLESVRVLAAESIKLRYTGTLIVEIPFLNGGVRTPVVRETRVFKMEKNNGVKNG